MKREDKEGKKGRRGRSGTGAKGSIPHDKRINLALIGEKRMNWALAIPLIVLIILLAALFSKFLVADRLAAVGRAERAAYEVGAELEEVEIRIEELEGLSGRYHHYSLSGMTDEEKSRARRQDVSRVINEISGMVDTVENFRVTGNALTVNVSAAELRSVSEMIGRLEDDPLVDTISISTAQTENGEFLLEGEDGAVHAQINIYLAERGMAGGQSAQS